MTKRTTHNAQRIRIPSRDGQGDNLLKKLISLFLFFGLLLLAPGLCFADFDLVDDSGNTSFSFHTTSRNVGIGLTNPAGLLEVGTTPGSGLTVLTSGNVGIGTNLPFTKLSVPGDLSASLKAGYLSTDSILLSQLEGGSYFGRVGVKESQWGLADYGSTWTQKDSTARNYYSVAMSSDGKIQTAVIYTNSAGQGIYVSTDYGTTWTQKNSTSRGYGCVAMSSDGKIQTALVNDSVAGQGIYVSTDYGTTWTQKDSTIRSYTSLAMSSDGKIQTVAIYGANGQGIYVSTDYGTTWTQKDSTSRHYVGVAMSSDGKVQTAVVNLNAAGQGIYVSTDYGTTWTQKDSTSRNYTSLAMSSDGKIQTTVVSGSSSGQGIYVSTDYGTTWTQEDSTIRSYLSVAMSSDAKIQTAVVSNGGIYVSTDYGTTWTQKDSTARNYYSVAMSSDAKIQTAVVSNGGIYVSHASLNTLGNVAIGTTAANARLDIQSSGTSSNFALRIADATPTNRLVVLDNGNVGIGTTLPGAALEVAGQVKITGGSPGASKVLTSSDASGLAIWQTPPASISTVKKAADQLIGSTSYIDVSDLSFSVSPNTDYYFDFHIAFRSSATSRGFAFSVNGPAAANYIHYVVDYQTTANASAGTDIITQRCDTAYDAMATTATTVDNNVDLYARIRGVLSNGNNNGTLTVRANGEIATSLTVKKGSWGIYY